MLPNRQIGVFWIYQNKIYFKTQNLQDIKPINGFIDSDLSHYKVWDEIKYKNKDFYIYEYEEVPRGRVVYDIDNQNFIVYCNKDILLNWQNKKQILEAFKIKDKKCDFKEDEHYII
jgi:hypothetical protein